MNKELYNELKGITIKELKQYLQRISEGEDISDEDMEALFKILLGMIGYRIDKNNDFRPFISYKIRNDIYMSNSPYHDEFNASVDAAAKEANLELKLLKSFEKYLIKSIKCRVWDINTIQLIFYNLLYISSMQKNREKYLIENARILNFSSPFFDYIPGEKFALEKTEIIIYLEALLKMLKEDKRALRKAICK